MSAALAQALDRVHGLEEELNTAKSESKALKDEVAQKEGQLGTLRGQVADQGEAIKGHDAEVRTLSDEIKRLDGERRAKDERIEALGREIEGLRAEILAQNPQKQAEQQIAAEAMKRQAAETAAAEARAQADATAAADKMEAKLAAKATRWTSFWSALKAFGLVAATALLLLFVLELLFGVKIPFSVWFGVPVLAGIGAILLPPFFKYIDKALEKVEVTDKNYKWGTAFISAVIGVIVAMAADNKEFSTWATIVIWLLTVISYGAIFFFVFKVFRVLNKDGIPTDLKEKARIMLLVGVVLVICGIVVTLFDRVFVINVSNVGPIEINRPISDSNHPLFFLGNALMSTMGIGLAVFVIGVLAWIGVRLLGTISSIWAKSRLVQVKEDKKLRTARGIVAVTSLFVGIVLGWGFYSNGNSSFFATWFMPIGVGVLSTSIFFWVKSEVVTRCYKRSHPNGTLLLLVVGAALLATLTAVISFGKVYYEASRDPRFMESKTSLAKAENEFLAAIRGPCQSFADNQDNPADNLYTGNLKVLAAAVETVNLATSRDQLVRSAEQFQEAASKLSACLPRGSRKLLNEVIVYPDPAPSAMSSQFFSKHFPSLFGLKKGEMVTIPGVSLHQGPAIQALVMVILLDYLPVLLAIFGWIFASRKRPEVEVEEAAREEQLLTGRIVTVLDDGTVIVDLAFESDGGPVEDSDQLMVLDKDGNGIGSLTKPERYGNGAVRCTPVRKGAYLQGLRARLPKDPPMPEPPKGPPPADPPTPQP